MNRRRSTFSDLGRRLAWTGVVSVAVAACAAQVDSPPESPTREENGATATARKESAADAVTLEVVDLEGYRRMLEKHRGKVVFVDFWATWCAPCVKNFPHTVHIARAFSNDQVAVVTVSFDDPKDKDAVLAFLKQHEARFDNLLSADALGENAAEKFDIPGGVIPHYKIYDRQGAVAQEITPGAGVEITLELLAGEVRKVLEAGKS